MNIEVVIGTVTVDEYSGGDPYYNWLTQSHLDTFADTSSSSMDSATTQSSLLFTVSRGSSRPRRVTKQPPVGPDFGKDRLGGKDEVDAAGELLMFAFISVQSATHLEILENLENYGNL